MADNEHDKFADLSEELRKTSYESGGKTFELSIWRVKQTDLYRLYANCSDPHPLLAAGPFEESEVPDYNVYYGEKRFEKLIALAKARIDDTVKEYEVSQAGR